MARAGPPNSAFALPLDTPPMEARSAEQLPADPGQWQYERKWDGFRCLAFRAGHQIALRAKSGKPLDRYFPEVVAMLRALPCRRFVVDGELVIEQQGHADFSALQMRLHPAESRVLRLSRETPARLVLFDLLVAPDGAVLLDQPLSVRRARLVEFARAIHAQASRGALVLPPVTRQVATARRWLAQAGQGDTDGVVAKRLDAVYQPGERAMIKVKPLRSADCVVGGYRYLQGRHEVGSLLLGLYDEAGRLDHVGFTSTIPEPERAGLTARLEALRAQPGFTGRAPGGPSRWANERSGAWEPVRPVLVVEVRFDQVTAERFRHGTTLLRWRPDKAPRQCTLEQLHR